MELDNAFCQIHPVVLSSIGRPPSRALIKRPDHAIRTAHRKGLNSNHTIHSKAPVSIFAYKRASVSVRKRLETYRHIFRTVMRPRLFDSADLRVSFAVTGSLARLTLLGCALGYRRFCYVGIDLGSTPYFWQEAKGLRGAAPWQDKSGLYNPKPTVTDFQTAPDVVPGFFDFLRILKAEGGQDLSFETLDPKGRSRLTQFLRDDLNKE